MSVMSMHSGAGSTVASGVFLRDNDSGFTAEVTQAGLAVDISDPIKIGSSTYALIDDTQRRLDTTVLVGTSGYPMELELEAHAAPCRIYQGDSTVTLPAGHLKRIQADSWELVTVSGASEAYFAILRESTTTSGLLVATRKDSRF